MRSASSDAGLQIDLVQGMMDCLYAECIPCITQCVMAELEKLGQHYRVALKVAKVRLLVHQQWQCMLRAHV
jgi:rRNA-processing protein FCF1